jgi:protein TonB
LRPDQRSRSAKYLVDGFERRRLYTTSPRQRAVSALASSAIVAGVGTALMLGLAGPAPLTQVVRDALVVMDSEPVEPLPKPQHSPTPVPTPTRQADKSQSSRQKEDASPANLRNRATEVFAPVLPPIRTPPPIVAAPRPANGDASNTGASDRIGIGQGAGGIGDGTGGGGNGDGDGDGDEDAVTRPIQVGGKLRWSDLPRELRQAHSGGDLELTYRVNIDGRVSDCRIVQSSGLPTLDAQTCRLITERFRFRPSRDARGRPVAQYIIERHGWDAAPDDVSDVGDD